MAVGWALRIDQAVLQQLAEEHRLPAIILQHRSLSKLKGTYTDPLPQLVSTARAGVPWLCAGVTWLCAGVPWLCAGEPWLYAGVPWLCAGVPWLRYSTSISALSSVLGYPGSVLGYPGSVLGYPSSVLGYPGSVLGYPGSVLGYPGSLSLKVSFVGRRSGEKWSPPAGAVRPHLTPCSPPPDPLLTPS